MEDERPYYIGIDLGTNSVGWAVTDEDYNILKYKKKNLWGARLFEEGKTSQARREKRSLRRRLKRRVHRIKLLQDIFKDEIAKVDNKFFLRLNESKYYQEDKDESLLTDDTLFADVNYNDKDYHKEYPTIFHLRKDLMESDDKKDIRLIYLALHHIIKNRGNFLHEGSIENITDFKESFEKLNEYLKDNDYPSFKEDDFDKIEEIISNKELKPSEKEKQFKNFIENKQLIEVLKGIVGLSCNLTKLFDDESILNDQEKSLSIKLGEKEYDILRNEIEPIINENIELIDRIKGLYDWSIINDILKNSSTLSEYRVKLYEEHKEDLAKLKYFIKNYGTSEEYFKAFKDINEKENYVAYIGLNKKGKKKEVVNKISVGEDPLKTVNNYFKKVLDKYKKEIKEEDKEIYDNIINKLNESNCLKKIRTNVNGTIPYQLHKKELEKIIEKASKYYLFLNDKDDNGYIIKDKIIKIMEFKIPYYVGPLNPYHKDITGHAWIEKKSNEKILPWNFEEVVDTTKTAEKFIIRMTNKCTYLLGEDVLPKASLLYQKFMLLNELNNMKIRGDYIAKGLKDEFIEGLFKKKSRVSIKDLCNYYEYKYQVKLDKKDISGLDITFKSNLSSYVTFSKIFEGHNIELNPYNDMIENIIKYKTIYGDNKDIFEKKIRKDYSQYLTEENVKAIKNLNFSGFGNLSKKLLLEIPGTNKDTGESFENIMEALENTNDNLMKILSDQYTFMNSINEINKGHDKKELTYENIMNERYISPAVKKSTWQAIKIIEEIIKIKGYLPEKVFLETTREEQTDKKRTTSRKEQLKALYKNIKEEYFINSKERLENFTEDKLRDDKLYLYYQQLGKSMYSDKLIDLDDLLNNNTKYDIDHIYPYSQSGDDSINNRVLVLKDENNVKQDSYPLSEEIRIKNASRWKMLRDKNLISEEKYKRLTRNTPLTDEELSNFVARQIVETSQSIKILKDVLEEYYENIDVNMIKVSVSKKMRMALGIRKIRELNNFHHAHDAYIAILSGDIYTKRFTKDIYNYFKDNKLSSQERKARRDYNLNGFFTHVVYAKKFTPKKSIKNEVIIEKNRLWSPLKIPEIVEMMDTSNILVTRKIEESHGNFYDETLYRKTDKNSSMRSLKEGRLSDISKYGGYDSLSIAYFFIVKFKEKNKEKVQILSLPVIDMKKIKTENDLKNYCIDKLKLEEPKILINKLRKQTKISYENHDYRITGKGNGGIVFVVNNNIELYIKNKKVTDLYHILKYLDKYNKLSKKYIKNKELVFETEEEKEFFEKTELKIRKYYEKGDWFVIDEDMLNNIYLLLQEKCSSVYKNMKYNLKDVFVNSKDAFYNLDFKDKVEIIKEVLKIFNTTAETPNFEKIGYNKKAGRMSIGYNVTDKKFYIHNESITGVFENKIRIK